MLNCDHSTLEVLKCCGTVGYGSSTYIVRGADLSLNKTFEISGPALEMSGGLFWYLPRCPGGHCQILRYGFNVAPGHVAPFQSLPRFKLVYISIAAALGVLPPHLYWCINLNWKFEGFTWCRALEHCADYIEYQLHYNALAFYHCSSSVQGAIAIDRQPWNFGESIGSRQAWGLWRLNFGHLSSNPVMV